MHSYPAACRIYELFGQGVGKGCAAEEGDGHIIRKPGICYLYLKLGEDIRELSVQVIICGYLKGIAGAHYHSLCGIYGYLCAVGIGSHKTAAPKQYAPEITCYNAAHIGQPFLAEDFKNGHACGSLGLAVVAVSGNAAVSENVCVDIVGRLAVQCAYLVYESHRFLVCFNVADIADKFGLFLGKGSLGAAFYRLIIGSVHSVLLSKKIACVKLRRQFINSDITCPYRNAS